MGAEKIEVVAWLVMYRGRAVGYATKETPHGVMLADGESICPVVPESLLLDARAERDAYERAAIRALQRTERAEALAGEYERDARRYRWLRAQQWSDANMFVVCGGNSVIKLGVDCPNLDRLDTAIDAIGGRVEK